MFHADFVLLKIVFMSRSFWSVDHLLFMMEIYKVPNKRLQYVLSAWYH